MNTPEDWLSLANDDLNTAEFIAANMRPVPAQIVCYHCQQAGEKYLKGYLSTKLTVEPPYIHDVARLAVLCEEYDPAFSSLKNAAYLLSEFATKTRYDRGVYPTEDEMESGLVDSKQIRDFVTKRMAAPDNPNVLTVAIQ
jgi:HEPN domain-containing protein